jgi:hypothetical protein
MANQQTPGRGRSLAGRDDAQRPPHRTWWQTAPSACAKEALEFQRVRLRAALTAGRLADQDAEAFAVHVAAVNQSLAVMSRAGAGRAQLRAIVNE